MSTVTTFNNMLFYPQNSHFLQVPILPSTRRKYCRFIIRYITQIMVVPLVTSVHIPPQQVWKYKLHEVSSTDVASKHESVKVVKLIVADIQVWKFCIIFKNYEPHEYILLHKY
jgi:hypothetical protein